MTPDQIRADDDDSDRVRSTFDRADNTARLALELAEAKREIARLRDWNSGLDAGLRASIKVASWAKREIAALHRDALAEAQAYRAMFARAQEAEAEVKRQATARAEAFEDGYDCGHADAHADGAPEDVVCRAKRRAEAAEAKVSAAREAWAMASVRMSTTQAVMNLAYLQDDLAAALGIEQ